MYLEQLFMLSKDKQINIVDKVPQYESFGFLDEDTCLDIYQKDPSHFFPEKKRKNKRKIDQSTILVIEQ